MNDTTKSLSTDEQGLATDALVELGDDELASVSGGADCTYTVSVDSTGKVTVTISCKR